MCQIRGKYSLPHDSHNIEGHYRTCLTGFSMSTDWKMQMQMLIFKFDSFIPEEAWVWDSCFSVGPALF